MEPVSGVPSLTEDFGVDSGTLGNYFRHPSKKRKDRHVSNSQTHSSHPCMPLKLHNDETAWPLSPPDHRWENWVLGQVLSGLGFNQSFPLQKLRSSERRDTQGVRKSMRNTPRMHDSNHLATSTSRKLRKYMLQYWLYANVAFKNIFKHAV